MKYLLVEDNQDSHHNVQFVARCCCFLDETNNNPDTFRPGLWALPLWGSWKEGGVDKPGKLYNSASMAVSWNTWLWKHLKTWRGRCGGAQWGSLAVVLGPRGAQKWAPFLQGWCQHISHAGTRIFEEMGHGIFDVEQQSLIMDKNQIDIHRVINK